MTERPLTKFQSRSWRRFTRWWPTAIWISLIVAAWIVYTRFEGTLVIDGVVEVATEGLGSVESGLIIDVPVVPGQRVRAGDIVARLDTALIEQEIEVLKETIRRRNTDTHRLYSNTINRLKADRRDMVVRLAEDSARLDVLRREVARLEELVDQRLVTADILVGTRARIAALDSTVNLYPSLIEQIDAEIAETRGIMDALNSEDVLQAEYAANMAFLKQRQEARTLRARHDGIVAEIAHQAGEVVRVGIPVVKITIEQAPVILGFLHEIDLGRVVSGQVVYLTPANNPDREIQGRVENLIPRINLVPDATSPLPNKTSRGMTMVVRPTEAFDFTPGQKIEIRVSPKGSLPRLGFSPDPASTAQVAK
jgi:HlyD family secretion protein